MNFLDMTLDSSLKENLNQLEQQNRLPHAVIINGGNGEERKKLAVLLAMWAVCKTPENRPCGKCSGCIKAKSLIHSDVYIAEGQGKTGIYNIDEMRRINADTVIKPNEAANKVYIFFDADKNMPVISQNTFLKTLEEPPQNVLFILTCANSGAMLPTILSRAAVFSFVAADTVEDEIFAAAQKIALGIVNAKEDMLLFATGKLTQKQFALETLPVVSKLLRDGLVCSAGGEALSDQTTAKALCSRLTREKLLKLIDINEDAIIKINQNANLNLLATWLCGEYRRIAWQK